MLHIDGSDRAVLAYVLRLRGRWLDSLSPAGRAALAAMSRDRIEALFAEWLRTSGELN